MNDEVLNTVIIGSGPAGLTAAIYAARAEIKPVLIAGLNPGGQLMQTTEVENFPGFPEGILGPDLMANMTKQAERFGTKIMQENVESVDFSAKPFKIKTDKAEYLTKTVILAMGAEANWLNLPNEQRLRGKGVSACATCDGFFFKNKEVVVAGGGDAAMEEAIFLTKYASKVTMLNRTEEFRASKIMLSRAQANPKIEFITNVQIVDVLGDAVISGVRLKDSVTGEERDFVCGGMFVAIGHSPSTKFLNGQIELDQKGYAIVKNNTESSVEGVFIAGDVADHRYRQAITAAGAGTMAALDVEKYLAHHI
ncbi:MAG: thioredoxin reductase [Candidatus Doudnabacteria bacterium]|nr:thioredoxin reductase [Candidatus Doudnabacteria bacterium]